MGESGDESSKCDIIPQVPNDLKPMKGQEFSSLDEVLEFYNAYAKHRKLKNQGVVVRYCSWHILNKFSEKLDVVKYSVYYKEFYYCIWNSKSKEEFDLVWLELVQRSGLQDNKWLQSMFEIRLKWVPAYTRHVFSAEMTSSQRAESSHSFFKKYVGEDNSMVDFMVQFDRGLQKQRHEALIADNKDVIEKPKLKMLNDILVQMVDIYTNEIFYKFQNELLESFNYKFQIIEH
ncbi:hypothetical protein AQUCO_00300024v1 [Aquilegia coerulea]|uniref:Protein FAR1-RELATED SEQUENCE n=1 Tax=Aquilegia coerulea TaxID=218851 RepID=A0A2G5EWX2_AQUCA|nr:hypothetical protein AQUCO_00300024v1 [Aquilegia coerulea]